MFIITEFKYTQWILHTSQRILTKKLQPLWRSNTNMDSKEASCCLWCVCTNAVYNVMQCMWYWLKFKSAYLSISTFALAHEHEHEHEYEYRFGHCMCSSLDVCCSIVMQMQLVLGKVKPYYRSRSSRLSYWISKAALELHGA